MTNTQIKRLIQKIEVDKDKDGNVVNVRTLAQKSMDVAWVEPGSNMRSAILTRMKYEDIFTSDIIKGIVIILALGVCVTIIIPIVKYIIYRRKYNKANINDKLIMTYSRRVKKWARKNKALKSKVNYKEQIQYLIDVDVIKMSGEDKEKVIDILGQAGFSKELIKEDENELVRRNLYL